MPSGQRQIGTASVTPCRRVDVTGRRASTTHARARPQPAEAVERGHGSPDAMQVARPTRTDASERVSIGQFRDGDRACLPQLPAENSLSASAMRRARGYRYWPVVTRSICRPPCRVSPSLTIVRT